MIIHGLGESLERDVKIKTLISLVAKDILTIEQASEETGISVDKLKEIMNEIS